MVTKVKAARGVLWSLLEYGGGEGLSFVVFLLLARLVAPADFGVVALGGVFVALVQVFLVNGFSDALIQRSELSPEHCSTAFWSNIGIAAALFIATMLLAEPLAVLFGQPLLADVLRWLAPLFVFTALNSVHQALFKRDLHFANLALRSLAGVAAGGLVGIGAALAGYGVWSLVAQQLVNGLVGVVVIWRASEWRPTLRFSTRCFRDMAGFSGNVIASNLATFVFYKTDVVLLGFFVDAQGLGYYYLVQRLLLTTVLVTQSAVLPVILPVLSRLKDDRERFREFYVTAVQITQSVYVPLTVGLGVVALPLVPLLFGERWAPTVPLLLVMSTIGFTQLYTHFSGPALFALGRPDVHLRLVLFQVALRIVVFLPLVWWQGLYGAALSFALTWLLIIPPHLWMMSRIAGVGPWALPVGCRASTIAGIAMAVAVLWLKPEILAHMPLPAALAALIVVGGVVYLAMLIALGPREVRRVLELLGEAMRRRSPATP